MNRLPTILLVPALLLPLVGTTGNVTERGCSQTRNGLVVPRYTGSLMVDGVLFGDAPGVDEISTEEVNAIIADLDILHVWIGCLEIERDGKTIGVRLLSFITKGGAVGVMRSHLEDLVEAQEEYRRARGAYAEAVADLHFLASHPSPPIDIVVTDGGWTATMRAEREETLCISSVVVQGNGASPPEITANCQVRDD